VIMSVSVTVQIRRGEKKKGWFQRAISIFKRKVPVVKAGFPAGTTSADNIMKAIWQEFGTDGNGGKVFRARNGKFYKGGPIPERPFLRTAVRDNHGKYVEAMTGAARDVLNGNKSVEQVMELLGMLVVSDIQAQIDSNMGPPNSPVTIEIKGSSHTLIDTGAMRAAVTYQVTSERK